MAGTNTKKRTRCPNGTRRNPKTGNCEPKKAKSGVNTKKVNNSRKVNNNRKTNNNQKANNSNSKKTRKVYKYKVKAKPGPTEHKQKKAMQNELMELSRPYQAHKKAQIEKKRLAKLIKANNLQRAKAELKGGAGHEDYVVPGAVTEVEKIILSSFESLESVQTQTQVPDGSKGDVNPIHDKIKSVLQAKEGEIIAKGKTKARTALVTQFDTLGGLLSRFDLSQIFYLVDYAKLDATTSIIYHGFTKIGINNAIILYEQGGKFYFILLNSGKDILNDRLAIEATELLIAFYLQIKDRFDLDNQHKQLKTQHPDLNSDSYGGKMSFKKIITTMAKRIRTTFEEIRVGVDRKYAPGAPGAATRGFPVLADRGRAEGVHVDHITGFPATGMI